MRPHLPWGWGEAAALLPSPAGASKNGKDPTGGLAPGQVHCSVGEPSSEAPEDPVGPHQQVPPGGLCS